MTFDEVLEQIRELLQREDRVSYRALKIRFNLDDEYLEALKDELSEMEQMRLRHTGDYRQPGVSQRQAERAIRLAGEFVELLIKEVYHAQETPE